jgi:hypothetical protein
LGKQNRLGTTPGRLRKSVGQLTVARLLARKSAGHTAFVGGTFPFENCRDNSVAQAGAERRRDLAAVGKQFTGKGPTSRRAPYLHFKNKREFGTMLQLYHWGSQPRDSAGGRLVVPNSEREYFVNFVKTLEGHRLRRV